jgi:hypothetical protein
MNTNQTDTYSNIYVLLTDTGTLFTSLIKSFTSAPYNHASLAFDEELNQVYSFGRKNARNPWSAGFVEEDVYHGTFSCYPNTRCVLLRLRITRQQRAEAMQIIQRFKQNSQDYRYNLLGLFGVLIDLDLRRNNAYFCSQFVADTITRTGIPLWERPSALITPNDFLHHDLFQVMYEGYLYDYPLLDRNRIGNIQAHLA